MQDLKKKILIVDDEESVHYAFQRTLGRDYKFISAMSGAEALTKFQENEPHLVILDLKLPDLTGMEVLKEIKQLDPHIPVIVITAFADTETAIQAMKEGAFDYICKPFDLSSIKKVINKALVYKDEEQPGHGESSYTKDKIVGRSKAILEISKLIGIVGPKDVPVLITGESGVGKELVARAIHSHSKRRDKPFVVINCAAIPDTLIESELFGYEPGAFTSAEKRKLGKFEMANGGTLFLDEIGEMGLLAQAKLLRVLEEKRFERLGGNYPIKVDIRIIAATNKNLLDEVKKGNFRGDLYHRLNVVSIKIPPLRERKEDIPLLAEYFLEKFSMELGLERKRLSDEAMEMLQNYSWPGNVRELQNVLKRAVIVGKGSYITKEDIYLEKEVKEKDLESILTEMVESFLQTGTPDPYHTLLKKLEKLLIKKALEITNNNQFKASLLLNINRLTLRKKMEEYGL